MLKDNAIPALFDCNKHKQPKRRSTLSRNEIGQKSSTVRKHLNYVTRLRNLNMKLIDGWDLQMFL